MYVYNYRIFDRYGRRVASFAILADEKSDWRPGGFGYNLLGCKIDFRFPAVKLLDFVGKEAELEANPNPFAVVILAFLSARQTAKDDNQRRVSKIRLIRSLYDRGLARSDVEKLFALIDRFMVLPTEMEDEVWHEVEMIEQEKQMISMTPREQRWLEQGEAKGRAVGEAEGRARLEAAIELVIRLRFGASAAATLMPNIRLLTPSQLDESLKLIETSASPDGLREALSKSQA
jgi:hypothetical protein